MVKQKDTKKKVLLVILICVMLSLALLLGFFIKNKESQNNEADIKSKLSDTKKMRIDNIFNIVKNYIFIENEENMELYEYRYDNNTLNYAIYTYLPNDDSIELDYDKEYMFYNGTKIRISADEIQERFKLVRSENMKSIALDYFNVDLFVYGCFDEVGTLSFLLDACIMNPDTFNYEIDSNYTVYKEDNNYVIKTTLSNPYGIYEFRVYTTRFQNNIIFDKYTLSKKDSYV